MLIELYSVHNFLGFIYPCNSGIIWTNQTGGTMCNQPRMEGIFIPLSHHWLPNSVRLIDYCDENYDPKLIRSFLRGTDLDKCFRALTFRELKDHELIANIMEETDGKIKFDEAWVPVIVRKTTDEPHAKPFAGKLVILTYTNSD